MRDSDIISVGPTIWSRDNGQLIRAETDETNSNPYYRNNVPSPLIIPSFAATHAGTYRCESGSVVPVRVNATFSLTAGTCNCNVHVPYYVWVKHDSICATYLLLLQQVN